MSLLNIILSFLSSVLFVIYCYGTVRHVEGDDFKLNAYHGFILVMRSCLVFVFFYLGLRFVGLL